ncbi:hypothetical protein AUK40_00975 [Candidatus Wirthbacteria bacterium CG2_30_54_11]|uniref:4Fe-4S ferredoxin-type domain-containing protein n=1 Tax=Candidatus Wirthbacteria bacterium CG2_30_54_11 TaxID=1817892 RepID=A0A1J5IQL7_9BACT|nr:MAG: hypothetical protein AUK40_00975 [Candidatus Wirthbacteria bacterium CG2_30_54_11]
MKTLFLRDEGLGPWVEAMMARYPVLAPVARKSRFVFAELEDAKDVRLDYDTTILPPKKAFFPPKQDLVHFTGTEARGCIDPQAKVLFGVHPYDIKAIHMLDVLFREGYADHNYLANREHTYIVGSSVQKHYEHAFFGSVSVDVPVTGHDLFLTRVEGGYTIDVLTAKGEELVNLVSLSGASDIQANAANKINADALTSCPKKLNNTAQEIQAKVRASWNSPLWEEVSDRCFSCGSCNTVCPTCYCFDVQDVWHIDQKGGTRYRRWDACMTSEFAEVSVQGGTESFRKTLADRFRHRIMRKAVYLNDKLGGPACVGCGRCAGACTADIADPTAFINTIMEAKQ